MLIRTEQSIFTTRLGYGSIERISGVRAAHPYEETPWNDKISTSYTTDGDLKFLCKSK